MRRICSPIIYIMSVLDLLPEKPPSRCSASITHYGDT